MASVTWKVEGMSCGHCAKSVEGAVKNAGAKGKVDLAGNTVSIEYDEAQVKLEAVKAAIEDQGYDVVQ